MSDPSSNAVLRGALDLSSLRNRPTAPAPASAPAEQPSESASRLIFDVTDQTFGEVLELSRTVPVVVDLWADWCGPCKQLSPVLEKVVTELAGRVVLAKVDVDAN
ncbi:MAG: co-chaperone YbbN, partial [Microbacterium sp.]|nr:co-chaperone YbbN [Microbacterium sp.]